MSAEQASNWGTARDQYGATFARDLQHRTTRQRIMSEVYGDDYPADARPRSFVTRTELQRMARALRVGPGQTFVDLGCGDGGPGLWLARETGAMVTGLDLASEGIARAATRAKEVGLADRARFTVADLLSTGLPAAGFDGAVSIDVLWSVPDKAGALREAGRILKPGARFVFTTWDRDRSPPGYPPPLSDHRLTLAAAGWEVEAYEIQPEAERFRRAVYERLVAAEQELIGELGEEGAAKALFEPGSTLGLLDGTDYLAYSRRIFVVARWPGASVAV